MDITITINTNNADLSHYCEDESCGMSYDHMSLSSLLNDLAIQVRGGQHNLVGSLPIRDINGNTVGQFKLSE